MKTIEGAFSPATCRIVSTLVSTTDHRSLPTDESGSEGRFGGANYLEQLPDQPGTVAKILLDQLAADDAQEGGRRLVGDGLGQQCLAGARRAVEDDALRRLDAHLLVELRVQQGQLDRLPHLLDLLLEAANVSVRLGGGFVELHDVDGRVGVVGQDADDADALMVQQDAGAGLEQVLVDEAHDTDVVLGPRGAAHDGVVVVDHLLERADAHGAAAHVIDTAALVGHAVGGLEVRGRGRAVVLGGLGLAQALLVLDVFLLEQQVVVDALHPQETQLAAAGREDGRQLGGGAGAASLSLLAADAGGGPRGRLVLGLILLFVVVTTVSQPKSCSG